MTRRRRWHNHLGDQRCRPQAIAQQGSIDHLVEWVRSAESSATHARAVGAGHAWSDVALTDGFLLEPGEGGLLEIDDGCLTDDARGRRLVRVISGTHLRTLNAELDAHGLALPNMGGYDAQTIAGVVSTSTHGSGLKFPPFPDLVRSIDLVVSGGDRVRVEPDDGPTDRTAFEERFPGWRLIEDERTFRAAQCGIGTLGLIHSLVLEVREKFWLNEVRELSTWEAVRDSLTDDGALGEFEHYELFLNPYASSDGKHHLIVTRREECPEPVRLPQDKLERHPLTELEASIPLTGLLVRLYLRLFPGQIPRRLDEVLERMEDDGYANVSYKVFNIGAANKLPAYSMELGVSLENDAHLIAVDRILEIAQERREQAGLYSSSPIALRFVAPSKAYASMMYERPTMMIELIMVKGTKRGYETLAGYQSALADLGVRPHWGQYNTLSGSRDRLASMYPRWEDWLAVEREFNSSGVFDSRFTRRVGISAKD
jgi:hypothetical protein